MAAFVFRKSKPPACLHACMPACQPACLPRCQSACLPAWQGLSNPQRRKEHDGRIAQRTWIAFKMDDCLKMIEDDFKDFEPYRRCLSGLVFLHRLMEFETDTFRNGYLSQQEVMV